jgi:hypothetical protein
MLGNVGAITTAQTSPDMALGFLISLILMAPAWVAVSVMEDDKTSPKMTIRLHVTTCFKAMLSTNPIGATYFALRFTLWLACKVPTIIRAIVFFILLVTFGLTKCRARTAAMTGAAVGTLVGYLSWNPLLVGLVGGTSASLAHFVSRRFGAWIERTLSEVKAGFSKTAEVKKP